MSAQGVRRSTVAAVEIVIFVIGLVILVRKRADGREHRSHHVVVDESVIEQLLADERVLMKGLENESHRGGRFLRPRRFRVLLYDLLEALDAIQRASVL